MTDTALFPGCDEPHYLVITQSLLHDGDLKIEGNHRFPGCGIEPGQTQ